MTVSRYCGSHGGGGGQPVLGLDADERGVAISYTLGGINSLATNKESRALLADPPLAESGG